MERVITRKNSKHLYLSLRFESGDPFKDLFCTDCTLYHQKACTILEKNVPNRIVSKINLDKITDNNIHPKCGDISEFL